MDEINSKAPGYRWVILFVFSVINAVMQMQWLTFAPIAREARLVYGVTPLQIDFLSMIFMGVFILVCIPASYIIDTFGIRIGVGFGALLIGIFSMLKGFYAHNYNMIVVSQIGLAVAQPFILNAATKVAGRWFPIEERATAVGIATLSQFLGIILAMIVTPLLVTQDSEGAYDLHGMLLTYGIISVAASILLLVFLKRRSSPAGNNYQDNQVRVFEGFRFIFKQRDMRIVLILFFIGLGMFNAVSTCIDQICQVKGLTTEQTGLVGGMMLIAGIIGAVILPILSDKLRKRKIFMVIGVVFMTPGLVGLTFATGYASLLISSFVLGFFLLGACAPIGFQYSAEVSYPSPESTSQGLILLVGQISGIVFIFGMNKIGIIHSMYIFLLFSIVSIILSFMLRESTMIQAGQA
ncbi:MAG: MFS transporter [Desulfobacterium sp.]|nr:MFS transporter [Desulfobacterium sp.]